MSAMIAALALSLVTLSHAAVSKGPSGVPLLPPTLPTSASGLALPSADSAAPLASPSISPLALTAESIGLALAALPATPASSSPGAASWAATVDAGVAFDGARPAIAGPGWTVAEFTSADGRSVAYKRDGAADQPARVFSGGLALNESFESLYAAQKRPGSQFFLWTRGHAPTAWSETKNPLDADARDLARLIVLAAKESSTGQAELVLHSFGTLVFQRLVQLRDEPEVSQALNRLSGSRVFLLNATTHYPGSERAAGRDFERMGDFSRSFVDGLDRLDKIAENWEELAALNPWLSLQIRLWLNQWYSQRASLIALASRGAADMMRADLKKPWPPAFDAIRAELLAALEHDRRDGGWQEALLRRSHDMFTLNVTKEDAQSVRDRNIRLELVHAASDELLNWPTARALFTLLGISSPEAAPAPGATLTDGSGLFRARVVDGDHYFPLKRPLELAKLLDP